MGLIKCEYCGHSISDKAPFCPKCGYLRITPISEENLKPQGSAVPPTGRAPLKTPKALWAMGIIGLLVLAGGIVWLVEGIHHHNEQYLAELEYERLERMRFEEQLRLEEQQRLEMIAAEQARLESIRQDSIVQEERFNLGQLSFISHNGDWLKILPKFGFKLSSKKIYTRPSDYDEDTTWEITAYVYERNLYGREVTFEFVRIHERGHEYEGEFGRDYCATMIIHDQDEKERFIHDVKKLNRMKEFEKYGYIWKASNIDHYISYSEGEIIFDTDH